MLVAVPLPSCAVAARSYWFRESAVVDFRAKIRHSELHGEHQPLMARCGYIHLLLRCLGVLCVNGSISKSVWQLIIVYCRNRDGIRLVQAGYHPDSCTNHIADSIELSWWLRKVREPKPRRLQLSQNEWTLIFFLLIDFLFFAMDFFSGV